MKKTICRAAVIAFGTVAALTVAASPASANPAGYGWTGSWAYTSPTDVSARLTVPGGTLTATGVDNGGYTRSFTVTLTDTDGGDGYCPVVDWNDATFNQSTHTTCGSITFPGPADMAVSVTLCLQGPTGGWRLHCNSLYLPDSASEPYIRNAGWGFDWGYNHHPGADWDARLDMGAVSYQLHGWDNQDANDDRLVESDIELSGLACGSGAVDGGIPQTVCGNTQTDNLPTVMSAGPYGTGAEGCAWPLFYLIGNPPAHNCLLGFVPMPN